MKKTSLHILMISTLVSLFVIIGTTSSVSAQKNDSLALTPPMGWNSWNTFGVNINEKVIREMADIMVRSGMKDAGYEYVVVDDGWEAKDRGPDGQLRPDPERFPSGMKALADYVHSKGLKFGIHNCAGTKTCNGFPGGRGHEYEDARLYASWGVDYLKYDWCYHGTANAEETYRTMGSALYATGRPIVYSLCEWGDNKPWLWGKDIAQLWRTTGDIMDCFNCQGVYSLGVKAILDSQVGLEKYAGPGHWNDPDMLEVGNAGLTLAESRAHFSLWCMLAAPLMAGNDLRSMKPEILKILVNKEVIAIDQDSLGKEGYRFMNHPGKEIWVKQLSGGDWAICVLNDGDQQLNLDFDWNHFYFMQGKYIIRDLWLHKNIGSTDKNKIMNFSVPTHDVLMLRMINKQ